MALLFESHLLADRAMYADMLEALRRGSAEILSDSVGALLLKDRSWELCSLAAADPDEGKRLLRSLGRGDVVLHGEELVSFAETLGYEHTGPLIQVLYDRPAAPEVRQTLVIRPPDDEDFEAVAQTYHIVDRAQLLENFRSGEFFGGYLNGAFVGYIGLHPEGSMGMLHVFEEYRRRGYARELYAFLIERQLRLGRIPYGQVFHDNDASLALQRSFGLAFARGPLFWMWK
jgi:tRNA (guanine37-N1)-methyltransferase